MRVFLAFCLCASAFAVPQGYNYQQQQQQQQQLSHAQQQQQQQPLQQQQHQQSQPQQATSSFRLPNLNFISQTGTKQFSSQSFIQDALKNTNLPSLLGGQTAQSPQFSAAPQFNQPSQQQNLGFSNAQQQQQHQPSFGSNFGGQQKFQGFQPLPPQQQQQQRYQPSAPITKDIYVHVAPEEREESQYQQQLPPAPPRKHYRIVFIKTPTPKVNSAALRINQAPTEEKTIIYVLTKKADPLDLQAAIQEAQPKQPSKPEVYFIKYKTQEEAQHAQRTIQAQYDQLGGTTQISDEGIAPVTSVIGSLDAIQPRGGASQSVSGYSSSPSLSSSSSSSSSSSPSSSSSSGAITSNASNYLPPIVKL